ncbi:MAG: hypothetical protein ACOZBH_03760 [Patescibacteria group bacterium]
MEQSLFLKSLKFFFKDLVGDIFYFPVWWYTKGLAKGWRRFSGTLRSANESLGLTIWIKNLFTPMFGQTDWQGRLVSFFMRLFQIIFRSLIFFGWLVFALIIFIIRTLFPILVVYMILFNLGLTLFKL